MENPTKILTEEQLAKIVPGTTIYWKSIHGDKGERSALVVQKFNGMLYCKWSKRHKRADVQVWDGYVHTIGETIQLPGPRQVTRTVFDKYANRHGYTDIEPYEVIHIINEKRMYIRGMKSELTKAPSSVPGGFCAHTNNYEQRWKIESDESESIIEIRKQKNGDWKCSGFRFILADEPRKFYDYNF